ncbi:hypothetical protein [Brevundimonas sp.]|uniref:hypothetical protein n=1 Tax=Brevundimonas sp. TaxID=1871086 RepID=UPI003D6D535F
MTAIDAADPTQAPIRCEGIGEVSSNTAVEAAIGKLATTMRLCSEAHMRFDSIFSVDQEEAVNNLEHAFENKLEAFHTLFDVSSTLFPYHGHGDTALVMALRNAIHHRNHPLFRSFRVRLILDEPARWQGAAFLMAKHPTIHGASLRMHHFVRLDDIDARLDPSRDSPFLDRLKAQKALERFELIDRELRLGEVRSKASSERYPDDQIYLDVMPIFVSAVCRVFKALKSAGIAFKGFDAETYERPFTSEIVVDLGRLEFDQARIWR